MTRFLALSSTRKQILTTTSISLLFILTSASVLYLTASSSACVDFAPMMMTSWLNLGTWLHFSHSMVIRGLPLSMILRMVRTIRRPDALSRSEHGERTVDRAPLVLTYYPFNTQIKQYLIQNFRILPTDLQMSGKMWHTNATSAYKTCWYAPTTTPWLSSLSHAHVDSFVATPVSTSILSPRYQVLNAPLPSKNILHVCRKILCTAYPATDAPISTSVKLGKASEVDLVSICEAYARTLLDFLWPNISTLRATISQMCRCMDVFVSWHQHPAKKTGDEADFSARNSAAAWTKHKFQLHLNSVRTIFLHARTHLT